MKKKTGLFLIVIVIALFLAACQANYIRDVQGAYSGENEHSFWPVNTNSGEENTAV
ncbi:TPA: colicin release lysis protein [Salmonella enterica]